MKPVVPAQLSLFSWHHSLLCWRAGAVAVLWAANRSNAKQRLTANSVLLSGHAGLSFDGAGTWALWQLFDESFQRSCRLTKAAQKLSIQPLSSQTFDSTLLVMWTNSNWLLPSCTDLFLCLTSAWKLLTKTCLKWRTHRANLVPRAISNNCCLLSRQHKT